MARTTLDDATESRDELRLYQQERAIESVTAMICRSMDQQGIDRAELARRLKTTPGWITQLLDGEKNKTVRTLSDVCFALGHSLEFPCDHWKRPAHSLSTNLPRFLHLRFNVEVQSGISLGSAVTEVSRWTWPQNTVPTPQAELSHG